ncbi:MAG TPA: diguanylate cyclase [Chromatiaceae bacterium]|nr:diguanylate cyclase [Chromatiaceae bacterium]
MNRLLLLLAGLLVAFAVFFQWKIADDALTYSQRQVQYQQAMEAYRENNIYYTPGTTIQWIVNRQNPAGFFVANPDMLFEPSQLNDSTLRGTRYAITTLRDLGGLQNINRHAVAGYVMGLYQPDLSRVGYGKVGKYAGFKTLPHEPVGVRPTMDALMILEALGLLDDPRIDLERIWNFIAVHQNPDGGFWDEHYPAFGTDSSLKCTSFAARALDILHQHMKKPFPPRLSQGIRTFVSSVYDPTSGGYRQQPDASVNDSYNVFRAFISLLDSVNGDMPARRQEVSELIDMDHLFDYLVQNYYLPEFGAFSRYSEQQKQKPSIKATHLIIWLLKDMQYLNRVDTHGISKYVMSLRSPSGQYGGDIYTTYSAIGLLQKLGVPTRPQPPPVKPEKFATIPSFVPAVFFIAALLTLILGHQAKKMELQSINKALSVQATIDSLTGIYNRQKFESLLKEELEKYTRYHHPLSVIMFDVDNFKTINDTRGHLLGDQILKEIAAVVQEGLRGADAFSRWGGEEFIVLLPETDRSGAVQLAEKLRALLETSSFSGGEKVTASFGVTELLGTDEPESLVRRADLAMLIAKRKGKNRVHSLIDETHSHLKSRYVEPG